jgi:hypothetical protein
VKFKIIEIPAFEAVSSGVDTEIDFSESGILGKFGAYFSKIKALPKDSFMPRDFLFYDREEKGMVWWWALAEGMDDGGFEHVNFDGGYYLCYHYIDGDDEMGGKLYHEAIEFVKDSELFELDERLNHYSMGHIITPAEIIEKQGFSIMETFIPIRFKKK